MKIKAVIDSSYNSNSPNKGLKGTTTLSTVTNTIDERLGRNHQLIIIEDTAS
jgi:hypothetical protein